MTYPVMEVISYVLLAFTFYWPVLDVVDAWRNRPAVIYDPYYGRWRSARLVHAERRH